MNTCGPSSLAAQTLFLGASIADFNTNMAWGGRPSQLTVKLVEDVSSCAVAPFVGASYADDHYHTCVGDSCYIDENGLPYNTEISKEKIIPGKVYYEWTPNGFVSKYWYDQDPGFFGAKNAFTNTGAYNRDNYAMSNGFDIINTPVLFRIGNFSFAGLVQNWEQDYSSGGLNYNVTIESMDSILDQCYIILDKYAGAIFGKSSGSTGPGGPVAISHSSIINYGKIIDGNIPNVFNVYGFLESLGVNNFGGSNRNDNGISATAIIDALSVLTSSQGALDPASGLDHPNETSRRGFSPFGRIITKVPQENQTYLRITPTFAKMGFLPVTYDINGIERCHFALDLSELPRPPLDYRINEPVLSIVSFIQQVTTATGSDFYFDTIPATLNGIPYNIIKVKVITRSAQPDPRQIEKTIVNFQNNGYAISSSRIGKEKNTNTSRVMYIGAPQQRLYQAKSYRLAFSQTNYVYSPTQDKFVEFYGNVAGSQDAGQFGKYRLPSALSTRNPALVSQMGGTYANLFNLNENLKEGILGNSFDTTDINWLDANLSSGTRVGNYGLTQKISKSLEQIAGPVPRFFPLYKDVISPFFGFKNEEDFKVNTQSGENNVLRVIRPVWMDNWTGQIIVLMDMTELPKTMSVNLVSPYAGSTMFTISESEIRAASKGFDEYLTYCNGKMFTPDLFKMLKSAYNGAKKIVFDLEGSPYAGQGNAAGTMGQPTTAKPAPNATDIDYNLVFNQDFLRDFTKLYNLVNQLSRYYGAKYLVKMPEVTSYRDQQYSDVQIPESLLPTSSNGATSVIQVYKGSGKIFHNYDIATDGAWEEYGNVIDDNIIVGSNDWYSLTDDNGRIQPILGYALHQNIDYLASAICSSDLLTLNQYGYDNYELLEMKESLQSFRNSTNSTCESLSYPSIDISQLSNENFIVKNSTVNHKDAFGNPVSVSQKLYQKADVDQDMVFLDPVNLRNPCAVVNTSPIPLNGTSKFYSQDPNRTVIATASMEDLSICARLDLTLRSIYKTEGDTTQSESPPSGGNTSGGSAQSFVALADDKPKLYINRFPLTRILLYRITSVLGANSFLDLDDINTSVKHHTLSPKVAHPYFAAIPVKSNQYCYGPWINYPHLDKNIVFPDAAVGYLDNAIENLIGGTEVRYEADFAPWQYGGMSNLDQAVVYEIYNEIQYQQIIETATLNIPGLPIFGLGAPFEYDTGVLFGDILYNNQSYNINNRSLNYVTQTITPPLSLNASSSDSFSYNPLVDAPSIVNNTLTYNITQLSSSASPVAPIISNISCSVSTQNVGTTYSFRTYVQKLGFFNKENTDRIKKAGLDNIKTNKQISSLVQSFRSQLARDKAAASRDLSRRNFGTEQFQTGFYGTSPGNLLIGGASPFGYVPQNLNKQFKALASNKNDTQPAFEFIHGEDLGDIAVNEAYTESLYKGMATDVRWRTYVGSYMEKEAVTELGHSYNLKAAMSWDGIFSPVSFYPTTASSTYSLLKYMRPQCTKCRGVGKISEKVFDYKEETESVVDYACPYCSIKKIQIGSSNRSSSLGGETLPPYIITNTNDLNTILQFDNTGDTNTSTAGSATGLTTPINAITLQPIVVPQGEFRNINAQNDPTNNLVDRCRHCIQVVARGEVPPKAKIAHNLNFNLKTYLDKNTGQIATTNGQGFNPDYYPYDIIAQHDRVNKDKTSFVMNQRFFGLRGPIIMHAWGYDTEGYPVPNASDEPKILDSFARPARFLLNIQTQGNSTYEKLKTGDTFIKKDDTIEPDKLIYYTKTEGMQIMDQDNNWIFPSNNLEVTKISVENDLNNTPANGGQNPHLNPGDIITKQYEHNGSKWVLMEKSRYFALNWAERPDLWPVGPIDLRWDQSRRVWTANTTENTTYKFVYVTLEEDLIKENDLDESYPTRAFLDELEYSKQPLQEGFRRLVYVKDKTGYTAPKGIKLLCRYDKDSGFYEPISKPSVVAQGTLDAGGKAMISMDFAQGNRALTTPTLLVNYDNPLGFAVSRGRKAMFIFTRGQWTLTSIA